MTQDVAGTSENVLEAKVTPSEKKEEVMEVNATTVHLLDSAVEVELSHGYTKLISYMDFLQVLQKNLDAKDGLVGKNKEYFLPSGTFYFSISEKTIQICTYHPEGVKKVNYRGVVRDSVVPNIIISLKLLYTSGGNFQVVHSNYFATRDELGSIPRQFVTPSSGMSLLPFTNVYDNGTICFGSASKVSTVTLPDLRGLHSYYQLLFDAPFNDDLGLNALKSKFRKLPHEKWYDHLAKIASEGGKFPYSELAIY